jgi:hypothetical protein
MTLQDPEFPVKKVHFVEMYLPEYPDGPGGRVQVYRIDVDKDELKEVLHPSVIAVWKVLAYNDEDAIYQSILHNGALIW